MKTRTIKKLGVAVAGTGLALSYSLPAYATFNSQISFQGVLKQGAGFVADGTYCAQVTIKHVVGGTPTQKWKKTYGNFQVSSGAFTVVVSGTDDTSQPFNNSVFNYTAPTDTFTVDIAMDYNATTPGCSGATYPDVFAGIPIYAAPLAMVADQCNSLTGQISGSQVTSDGTLQYGALTTTGATSGNVLTLTGTTWGPAAIPTALQLGFGASPAVISPGSGGTTIGNSTGTTQIVGAATIGDGSKVVSINTGGGPGAVSIGNGATQISLNGNITTGLTTTGNSNVSLGVGTGTSSLGTGTGQTNVGTGTGETNLGNGSTDTNLNGGSSNGQTALTLTGKNGYSGGPGDGVDIFGLIPNGGANTGAAVAIAGTGANGNSNGVVVNGVGSGTGVGVGINVLGTGTTSIGTSSGGNTSIAGNTATASGTGLSMTGNSSGANGFGVGLSGYDFGTNGTGISLYGQGGSGGTGIALSGTSAATGVTINSGSGSTSIGNPSSPLSMTGYYGGVGSAVSIYGSNSDAGYGVQIVGNAPGASFATATSIAGIGNNTGTALALSGSATSTGAAVVIAGSGTSSTQPTVSLIGNSLSGVVSANPGVVIAGTGGGTVSNTGFNTGVQIGAPAQNALNSTQIYGAYVPSRGQISLFEEFGFTPSIAAGAVGTIGTLQGLSSTASGGTIAATSPTGVSRVGIARITSGSSGYQALGWCGFNVTGSVSTTSVLLSSTDRFTFDTEISVSSVAATNGILRIGLWDTLSGGVHGSANGVYIEQTAGSAVMSGLAIKASSATVDGTTASIAPGAFQRWTITYDGAAGNLQFYLNGTPFATAMTSVANLPTTVPLCIGIQQAGATSPSRTVDVDYMSFMMVPGTVR